MKNFLSRFSKDRVLITAMCAVIIMATAAALITMYNKNMSDDGGGILSEQQTEESTEKNEEVAEVTTEAETKNLTVKLETEPELATVPETEEAESNSGDMALAVNETGDELADEAEANASVKDEGDLAGVEAETSLSEAETEIDAENAAASADEVSAETEAEASAEDSSGFVMDFSSESTLVWPVEGEIIREFSMDTTVWFSTLKQYKTSDAIQIQSAAGTEVVAAANGQVVAVGENDELGSFVVMDLGNGYRATYAQLTDIIVNPGNYVTAGTAFACVAEPTYYYVVDGDHLYFKLTCDDELLDPLDYLE